MNTKTIAAADLSAAITRTAGGRYTVRIVDAVTNKAKRRTFRTLRLAEVFVRGHRATASYWRNSASAGLADDVAAGRDIVVHV
jgi:hypothetical protein